MFCRLFCSLFAVVNVPHETIKKIVSAVEGVDIEKMAKNVMQELFSALEMTFGFRFDNKEN